MRRHTLSTLSIGALLLEMSPAVVSAQQPASYTARGVIRSISNDRLSARIAHEAIPGFMGAMTMSFETRSATQLQGFSAGDPVRFTFTHAGDGHLWITSIARR